MSYRVTVSARFEAAHNLIHYRGQPEPLHGHSYLVEVVLGSETLDKDDLSADFVGAREAAKQIAKEFDYRYINEHPEFRGRNTSAENIARYFGERMKGCAALGNASVEEVIVWEGPENRAAWRA